MAIMFTPEEQEKKLSEKNGLLIDRALRQFAMMNAGSTPPGLVSPPRLASCMQQIA